MLVRLKYRWHIGIPALTHWSGLPCRYADPILDRLDPNRYIAYRLYRDSTQYVGGRHCRDLTKLNRDPARVLLVSADPDAYHLQPENAIKVAASASCSHENAMKCSV